jgi:hypothetical protein
MNVRLRTKVVLACSVLVALVATATAGGYAVGRVVTVPQGGAASFKTRSGGFWQCSHLRTGVDCYSGDARPSAQMTGINCRRGQLRRCGVNVKVHTLGGTQAGSVVRRRDRYGGWVWTFSAY